MLLIGGTHQKLLLRLVPHDHPPCGDDASGGAMNAHDLFHLARLIDESRQFMTHRLSDRLRREAERIGEATAIERAESGPGGQQYVCVCGASPGSWHTWPCIISNQLKGLQVSARAEGDGRTDEAKAREAALRPGGPKSAALPGADAKPGWEASGPVPSPTSSVEGRTTQEKLRFYAGQLKHDHFPSDICNLLAKAAWDIDLLMRVANCARSALVSVKNDVAREKLQAALTDIGSTAQETREGGRGDADAGNTSDAGDDRGVTSPASPQESEKLLPAEIVNHVGQALRQECEKIFGSSWDNDNAWRFARVAMAEYDRRRPSPPVQGEYAELVKEWRGAVNAALVMEGQDQLVYEAGDRMADALTKMIGELKEMMGELEEAQNMRRFANQAGSAAIDRAEAAEARVKELEAELASMLAERVRMSGQISDLTAKLATATERGVRAGIEASDIFWRRERESAANNDPPDPVAIAAAIARDAESKP